jgi:hypothetical protein
MSIHTSRAVRVSATTMVRFEEFAGLPAERNVHVLSTKFMCLGNKWQVGICPGGCEAAGKGIISVDLRNMSNESINIECSLSVKDCKEDTLEAFIFKPIAEDGADSFGYDDFLECTKIMDALVDGAIVM